MLNEENNSTMTDTKEIMAFEANNIVVYGYTVDGDIDPAYCESYDVVDHSIYDKTDSDSGVSGVIESFNAGQLQQALTFAAGYNARKRTEFMLSQE